MPNRRNYVLLLRHCFRSTSRHITVCDEKVEANKTSRSAKLSEFITAPLPEWGVPSEWCTSKGMDIIEDLGRFLVETLGINSTKQISVRIISDDSHRDVDTSLALLRSIKGSLTNISSDEGFDELDRVYINGGAFGHDAPWHDNSFCPSSHQIRKDYHDQIAERISLFLPSDFRVQDLIDRIRALDARLNNTFSIDGNSSLNNPRCEDSMNLSMELLAEISEMAFYSRVSEIDPPFLPSASVDDVYRMVYAREYIKTVESLDNINSARRGLILAKSMLNALTLSETEHASGSQDKVTVTVYVGHESNIYQLATVLGLRWALSPPYLNDGDSQRVLPVPPGSGIVLGHSAETDVISMSFVAPVDLIGNNTNLTLDHKIVPIYTVDMERPELNDRDQSSNTVEELRLRIEASIKLYPELKACFQDAPVYLGINDIKGKQHPSAGVIPMSKAIVIIVSSTVALLVLCAISIFARTRFRGLRPNKYREVQLDSRQELELS